MDIIDWFWPAAENHDIPVMVHAPERLDVLAGVAARHPGLRLIVDHMGFGRETKDDRSLAGAERVANLARHANIFVKVEGISACVRT